MTEGQHDGKKYTVEDALRIFSDTVLCPASLQKLCILAFYELLTGAVESLRHYLEKDRRLWKNPFLQLDYAVNVDVAERLLDGDVAEIMGEIVGPDLHSADDLKDLLLAMVEAAVDPDNFHPLVMYLLTDEVIICSDENGSRLLLNDKLAATVADLTDDQKEARLTELAAGLNMEFNIAGSVGAPAEKESFEAVLKITIRPLLFDLQPKQKPRIYFPVMIGLDFQQGNPAAWTAEDRKVFLDDLTGAARKALESLIEESAADAGGPLVSEPDQAVPIRRADYFKAPGRLFDTPLHAEAHNMLPTIRRWYSQTAFNRTVAMAAAALTKTKTRDAIFDWQSATVAEVEDLVYCRSEEGTPAHGQHREDILKAFEALRAIPIPIVRIDWKQIGTDRNPRWVKQYKMRVASLLQAYGPVFIDRKTGKQVYATDPALKKEKVKGRLDRKKTTRDLVDKNLDIVDSILECFPPDRYLLTGFEWRWNTDICEDFICPLVALDEKDRPRRKLKGEKHDEGSRFHHEGSRFINLNRRYFAVMKHLRDRGSKYGPRLLDLLVSEKKYISGRGKGFVWIEIAADKVIKRLDLWSEYQNRPKHVLEEHVAAAIMELIREKVLMPESWLVPQLDKNPDRRKTPFYRWKVAELWSTVALVPPEEAKEVEDAIVAEAKAARSRPVQLDPPADQDQGVLWEEPPRKPIPDGKTIRAAREDAALTLRDFARIMDGPAFKTWARFENGESIRVKSIPEAVWDRVRDFVEKYGPKDGKDGPEGS